MRRRLVRLWKYVWVSPATAVGAVGVLLARWEGGQCTVVDGVLEATGPRLLRRLSRTSAVGGGIRAITLGHIVIATDSESLRVTRRHERVHVRQYETWGPFFIPLYLLCSGWQAFRGRHPYLDNPFEVEAYRVDLEE